MKYQKNSNMIERIISNSVRRRGKGEIVKGIYILNYNEGKQDEKLKNKKNESEGQVGTMYSRAMRK